MVSIPHLESSCQAYLFWPIFPKMSQEDAKICLSNFTIVDIVAGILRGYELITKQN
jgi:hypothetical protein